MSKSLAAAESAPAEAAGALRGVRRPRIALLSNPKSTGNLAQLPRIREYCSDHPDVFHYEVEQASQIGEAMKVIARVRPKVLAINGGDGTVQAALSSISPSGWSTFTTSPSFAARRTSTPAFGAGTSTVILSVSSSTSVSPAATGSPSFFNQRAIVASTIDSPSGGTLNEIMTGPCVMRCG